MKRRQATLDAFFGGAPPVKQPRTPHKSAVMAPAREPEPRTSPGSSRSASLQSGTSTRFGWLRKHLEKEGEEEGQWTKPRSMYCANKTGVVSLAPRTTRFAPRAGLPQRFAVVQADMCDERSDAVVNAANEGLMHGGGLAGALSRRGGPSIQRDSSAWIRQHGSVSTGDCVPTRAGLLPSRWVIHAVGPIWSGGRQDEQALLRSAVINSLDTADSLGAKSISIPALSSGIFGYPKDLCAADVVAAVADYLAQHGKTSNLREIRFTNFDRLSYDLFREAMIGQGFVVDPARDLDVCLCGEH